MRKRILMGLASLCLGWVLSASLALPVLGQSTYWNRGPASVGDWFYPRNWTDGVPTSRTFTYIDDGGTCQVGRGTAVARHLIIGDTSDGTLVQTGGTVWPSYDLILGYAAGSKGTYELRGGTLLASLHVKVGDAGEGYFLHTGGQIPDLYGLGVGGGTGLRGTI